MFFAKIVRLQKRSTNTLGLEKMKTEILISTDRNKLDIAYIHQQLAASYWSLNIPYKTVEKKLKHSLCFGVYQDAKQIGFARVITDYTTFAYLADVFIDEKHRGLGYSKKLMNEIVNYPELQALRRWLLATSDAHKLYEQFGFKALAKPEIMMERHFPNIYSEGSK